MTKYFKIINSFIAVFIKSKMPAILLFLTIGAMVSGGCQSISHSPPVKGGAYLWSSPLTNLSEALNQGDNADSPSRLLRSVKRFDADGNLVGEAQTRVELGISRNPLITVKPLPAYGQYAVAVIGALAMIGGTVMAFKSWPKIGATLALGGFTVMVIALTSGQYGWLWALIAAGTFAAAAGALYSGYRSGLASERDTTAPPAASSLAAGT